MRKRSIQVIIRLDEKENEQLKKRVKKTGLSRAAYIRHLINGLVPTDTPPPDYFSMMKELRQIGKNLNQIAQKAHVLNVIDADSYLENVKTLNTAIVAITNAVMLPRKIINQADSCGGKNELTEAAELLLRLERQSEDNGSRQSIS